MAVDPASSSVFTGHADGSIRVHRILHAATDAAEPDCNVAAGTCCQGVAVRCLAIEVQQDAQPRCWAGDVQGRVSVHQLTALQHSSRQLQLLAKKTGEDTCHADAAVTPTQGSCGRLAHSPHSICCLSAQLVRRC